MVTAEVITKTFWIKVGNNGGTGFVVNEKGQQYLVTAYHVVKEFIMATQEDKIVVEVYHDNCWKKWNLNLVGYKDKPFDIAIFGVNMEFPPPFLNFEPECSLGLGQTVYFLGFPVTLKNEVTCHDLLAQFPMPFVKQGIMSNIPLNGIYYIDGKINKGFSGGPVVVQKEKKCSVIGIMHAYAPDDHPEMKGMPGVLIPLLLNSGISVATSSFIAKEIIQQYIKE
jgi:S1-C subfamily serine protease